jgi:hypothetical protein
MLRDAWFLQDVPEKRGALTVAARTSIVSMSNALKRGLRARGATTVFLGSKKSVVVRGFAEGPVLVGFRRVTTRVREAKRQRAETPIVLAQYH